MQTDAKLAVTADPRCVAAARQLVASRCAAMDAAPDIEAIELMVSEIVTNVIRHTPTGEGQLRLLADERALRIEVEDQGHGVPSEVVTPDRERGGGFGLYLVDRLSDRWGVWAKNCIWFEMDLETASSGPSGLQGRTGRFERGPDHATASRPVSASQVAV